MIHQALNKAVACLWFYDSKESSFGAAATMQKSQIEHTFFSN